MVGDSRDKIMNLILDMSSCGNLGNTWIYGMVPAGHHVMAFTPCSLPEQSTYEQKSKLCVYAVFLLLQKLFTKACVSWLDSFVKRTCDHHGEVTPSLSTKENLGLRGV